MTRHAFMWLLVLGVACPSPLVAQDDSPPKYQHTHSFEHDTYLMGLAFSLDGSNFVTASWSDIRIWDSSTGKQIQLVRGASDKMLNSPRSMGTTCDVRPSRVEIWDVAKFK